MGRLTDAVIENNLLEIQKLLKGEYQGSPLIDEEIDEGGNTALCIAAENGYVEAVEVLLQEGAKVDQPNKERKSPLLCAIFKEHVKVVKTLLQAGAKADQSIPNPNNEQSITPLIILLLRGVEFRSQIEIAQLLMEFGANVNQPIIMPVDSKSSMIMCPLTIAISQYSVATENQMVMELIQLLIKYNADSNQKIYMPNSVNITPLLAAIAAGYVELVELLIKAGAKVDPTDINQTFENGITSLFQAIKLGRVKGAQLLLEFGAGVNHQDDDGNTPLLTAITAYGTESLEGALGIKRTNFKDNTTATRIELIQLLLKFGAKINQPNKKGITPLHVAAKTQQKEIIELLLKEGADINAKSLDGKAPFDKEIDEDRNTALNIAAEDVELLLQEDAQADQSTEKGMPPIFSAVFKGDVEAVEVLLRAGAKADQLISDDERGMTPLIAVLVAEGLKSAIRLEITQLLIKSGANVNHSFIVSEDSMTSVVMTPLVCAFAVYRATDQDKTVLEIIQLLIKSGAELNQKFGVPNVGTFTPFFAAITSGYVELVELLIKAGAKVDPTEINHNQDGRTPIFRAVQEGRVKGVKLLLEYGAEVNHQDNDGNTPLLTAINAYGTGVIEGILGIKELSLKDNSVTTRIELIQLLLRSGAKINQPNKKGVTPLHVAVKTQKIEIVELLLKEGADINVKTLEGETPFILALGQYWTSTKAQMTLELIRLLIKSGVDLNQKICMPDVGIVTPLFCAIAAGMTELVELLRKAGAKVETMEVNQPLENGEIPLFQAIKLGRVKGAQLLIEFGAEVNHQDGEGNTPLLTAITTTSDTETTVRPLGMHTKAEVNPTTTSRIEPIEFLFSSKAQVKTSRMELIQLLLRSGAKINQPNKKGITPLHVAMQISQSDQKEIIELLLTEGADINVKALDGETPFDFVKERKEEESLGPIVNLFQEHIKLMVESGVAQFKVLSKIEDEKLKKLDKKQYAEQCREYNKAISQLLSQSKELSRSDEERYSQKEKYYQLEKYAKLALSKASTIYFSSNKETATGQYLKSNDAQIEKPIQTLTEAVFKNNISETTRLLLTKKYLDRRAIDKEAAEIRLPDRDLEFVNLKLSSVFIAASLGYKDVLQVLLQAGANANLTLKNGNTPLHFAAKMGQIETIQILLKFGAKINQPNRDGKTPFYTAAMDTKIDVMRVLLQAGASINQTDFEGRTPLCAFFTSFPMLMAKMDSEYFESFLISFQFLLENGAITELPEKNAPTPLHLAVMLKNTFFVKILLGYGAKVDIVTKFKGEKSPVAPLDIAKRQENANIIKLLKKGTSNENRSNMREEFENLIFIIKAFSELKSLSKEGKVVILGEEQYKQKIQESEKNIIQRFERLEELKALIRIYEGYEEYEEYRDKMLHLDLTIYHLSKLMRLCKYHVYFLNNILKSNLNKKEQDLVQDNDVSVRHNINVNPDPQLLPFSQSQSMLQRVLSKETNIGSNDNLLSYTIKHADLELGELIGEGGFGAVYKGMWKDTSKYAPVAIKQLLIAKPTESAIEEFQNEAKIMAQLNNPNIVRFYGCCLGPKYSIVMEYASNGSLFHVLHSKRQELEWPIRYRITLGVTRGLAFLHNKNILHRDLKSANVLLDDQFEPKLTDFGLSKIKVEVKTTTVSTSRKAIGTYAWMAPEILNRRGASKETDVYSLAVIFWEIATRKVPFEEAGGDQELIRGWVKDGERLEIPENCPQKLNTLMMFCWDKESKKRPPADEIMAYLESNEEDFAKFRSNKT